MASQRLLMSATVFAASVTFANAQQLAVRHHLSSDEFQRAVQQAAADGYSLKQVDGYEHRGQDHYAAIWERRGNVPVEARHRMTSREFEQRSNQMAARGFRLASLDGYTRSGQEQFVAVWEQREGPRIEQYHGMTSQEFQRAMQQLAGLNYHLETLSAYAVGNQTRFAAIWEQRQGPRLQVRRSLSSDEHQRTVEQLASSGFHLSLVAGYNVGNDAKFAAIWSQQAGASVESKHNMTSQEFQQAVNRYATNGFKIQNVTGYVSGNQVLYAAIWDK